MDLKARLKPLGILKPRHPTTKRELQVKLAVALFFTVVAPVLLNSISVQDSSVLGTFNPATGEIWIQDNLEPVKEQIVVAHEAAHKTFFELFPWWSTVDYMIAPFLYFFTTLGYLVWNRATWLLGGLAALIVVLPELHAYGAGVLQFGPHMLTLGNFIFYALVPVWWVVWGLIIFRKRKRKKKRKRAFTILRFKKKEQRRVSLYLFMLLSGAMLLGAGVTLFFTAETALEKGAGIGVMVAARAIIWVGQRGSDKLRITLGKRCNR